MNKDLKSAFSWVGFFCLIAIILLLGFAFMDLREDREFIGESYEQLEEDLVRFDGSIVRVDEILETIKNEQNPVINHIIAPDYQIILGDTGHEFLLRFDFYTWEVLFRTDGTVTVNGEPPADWDMEVWRTLAAAFPEWEDEVRNQQIPSTKE